MDLNTIRNDVLNTYLREDIVRNERVNSSKSLWESKTLIEELLKTDNIGHIDFCSLLLSLFTSVSKHLEKEYSPNSRSRGLLRGFIPIGQKAIEEAENGRNLEVPLERAMALANNWFCQFSCLSGYAGTRAKYKRKSIDLVWTPSKSSTLGYLIELKEWKSKNHILFAAIEVIIYWMCFINVRNIDIARKNPQASNWPKWSDFKLCVMAPSNYFAEQPKNYRILVDTLNKALQALTNTGVHNCDRLGVNSCKVVAIPLSIERNAFIKLIRLNAAVLTCREARQSDLQDSSILYQKLE